MSAAKRSTFVAILRQRCPRCRRGPVFRGIARTNDQCPECGFTFQREPGYFVGAMYFSYALSVGILGLMMWLGSLIWPEVDLMWIIAGAGVLFLPLVPVVFRYSRVLWMYFDHWAWPERPA